MAEKNDNFVNLMLEKANKKEETKPQEMLSPQRDPETKPQMGMKDEDMKNVEEYTENLKKKLQQ